MQLYLFIALLIVVSTGFILLMFALTTAIILRMLQHYQKGSNPVMALKPAPKPLTQQEKAFKVEEITKKLMEHG